VVIRAKEKVIAGEISDRFVVSTTSDGVFLYDRFTKHKTRGEDGVANLISSSSSSYQSLFDSNDCFCLCFYF
jgi:hypothetical protein